MRARDAALGAAAVVFGAWLAEGRPLPEFPQKWIPWRVMMKRMREYRQYLELEALQLANLYENSAVASEETKAAAWEEFGEIMSDNDIMDVWTAKRPRPHSYTVTTRLSEDDGE